MRMKDEERQTVKVAASGPDLWDVRVRRVGYVPVRHHNTPIEPAGPDRDGHGNIPGFVPDPLFDESEVLLPEDESHAFWITVHPAPDSESGTYQVSVEVSPERGEAHTHVVPVTLHNVRLEERHSFSITHWFYNDALMDFYETDGYDEAFWAILPAYLKNAAEHGLDTLYVPVLTPPLDGVKRPCQLLHITRSGQDQYQFAWEDVARYVETARKCGISKFEWCHLFTQWGARNAIRIYEGQGQDESLLWEADTSATSDTYRIFLSQFLPEFKQFLADYDLMDRSFFHISDEPHGEEHLSSYREARNMLRELAPWMPTMDALTEIAFASEGLTDMPIPSITTALDFNAADIPCWCYYCCGPRGRYLNRLLDTPLSKIAMHGLLFYRWPFQGFLHWGYNYWYKSQTRQMIDPFTVQDGSAWDRAWAYGDPFVVYPGPEGPIDSIRWEVFAESLQDYRLLQTLGVSRDYDGLTDLVNFEDFPKDERWRSALRKRIFSEAAQAKDS